MKKLIFSFFLLVALVSRANNIQVTNVSVVPANNTIRFTISWDNGWRSSVLNNWDAAWVFVKYYDPMTLTWRHLNFTATGNVVPAGFAADPGLNITTAVGYFLYRSAVGSGTTTITNVELGIPAQQATGIYDIKIFAIEMVYIPQAEFFVGDGVSLSRYSNGPSSTSPGFVSSSGASSVYDPHIPGNISSLSPGFPTGYNDFYTMKYELTQGAYRDFLNCLTYAQQANHTANAPNAATGTAAVGTGFRNFLEIRTPGVSTTTPAVYGCDADADNVFDESTDGEWSPCNYLNWPDQAAYLTWAALRPLTELEYEKACRGIQIPVAGEFAWGNTNVAATPYTITSIGTSSESVSNAAASPTGNAVLAGTVTNVVLRNGIFATATSNRISSGGGFYGTMDLTGNIWERVIATHNGSGFGGNHGNGSLTAAGYSPLLGGWPGFSSGTNSIDGTVNADGLINRGGAYYIPSGSGGANVSYRMGLILGTETARLAHSGIRGGRTAP
jgi:formylglycine-generating enzyme required for sulfatase activity